MAIRMMCDAGTPGAVKDDYWSGVAKTDIWMVTTHEGLVLSTGEYNGYDDSDFYAVVWNEEKGNTERVTYASTRGWTYPNGAAVDATDEVKAKYAARCEAITAELRAARDAREAAAPAKGKTVKTVRKVKGKYAVEAGVTGTVFWVGEDRFSNRHYPKMRVGFEAGGKKFFVAGDAVEVVA
jgi:hypothetical protein